MSNDNFLVEAHWRGDGEEVAHVAPLARFVRRVDAHDTAKSLFYEWSRMNLDENFKGTAWHTIRYAPQEEATT